VTSQPALTSSSGRVWLVVGAVLTAICLAVLLLVSLTNPAAIIGAAVVLALFVVLVVVRIAVRAQSLRLRLLAIVFSAIPVTAAVTLLLVISATKD
jgi:hypothetical protein